MSQRIRRKDLKHDEIAEAAFDFGHWIEENWRLVVRWIALAAVVGALIGGFFWMNARGKAEGRRLLAEGQRLFDTARIGGYSDTAEVTAALDAFEAVIERSADSAPGKVAQYYRASSLRHLGRFDEAIDAVDQLSAAGGLPTTLTAQTAMLQASLYFEAGRQADAIQLLEGFITAENSPVSPEQALLEIGRMHREMGEIDEAYRVWQRILDEYGETSASNEARQLLGPNANAG